MRLRIEQRLGNNEIATQLGVAKSSVSRWLRDHPLTADEMKGRWYRGGRRRASEPRTESKFHKALGQRELTKQQKGKIAEAAVMFRLVLHDYNVFGSVFDGDTADWVVEVPESKEIHRVQVRWAREEKHGKPLVSLRASNGRGKSRPPQDGDFDFIVGYDFFTDTCYVWSWSEVEHLNRSVTVCPEAAERWDKLRGRSST